MSTAVGQTAWMRTRSLRSTAGSPPRAAAMADCSVFSSFSSWNAVSDIWRGMSRSSSRTTVHVST
jgi:hypothetical protein